MNSDEKALEIETCRQIVKEIVNFGVSQNQLLLIMKMLAYEIEDHEKSQFLTSHIRDFLKDSKFLFIDSMEEEK